MNDDPTLPPSVSEPPAHPAPATPPATPPDPPAPPAAPARSKDPLHGITLEAMVVALERHFGWRGLAEQIPVRCFQSDPSVSSSLKFLRKTPWAREKVESLYLFMLREQRRQGLR
ncbi:VF530 family DNA-binding protein [Acidovorax sp. Leaf160]|uniref:VF530 family protein n=1 Tax=Acidovorax sp. Leaf160 TaxID=1736280 RepID=UPI0009EA9995|nr:VF530 family protein [Acidovorax sp. Leaf160]